MLKIEVSITVKNKSVIKVNGYVSFFGRPATFPAFRASNSFRAKSARLCAAYPAAFRSAFTASCPAASFASDSKMCSLIGCQ